MNTEQIHQKLTEKFGTACIAPLLPTAAGDAFIRVAPVAIHVVCLFLQNDSELQFDYLRCLTGVETTEKLRVPLPDGVSAEGIFTDDFAVIYHLYSYEKEHGVVLHVDVSRAQASVSSVADIWPAADWHEREAFDLLGVAFDGHPDLRRILLPDDWEGHPLRKDYVAPKDYNWLTNV